MKYNTTFIQTSIQTLTFIFLLLLTSCADDSKGNMTNEEANVPELLTRSEKIQNGKEWDDVQNQYMNLKTNITKGTSQSEDLDKIKLANLYIREARVTGEHGHYYPAALSMLDEVLSETDVSNDTRFLALTTKAGVQLSLHEFKSALETGNKAALMNPANAQIHGVLVDANVELGNYDKAVSLADRMLRIKPDIRSYSRASYLREIHGDGPGSIEAMKLAVKAGFPGTEETAWAMLTLGNIYQKNGDLEKAEAVYNELLQIRPDYPFAVGALGALYLERGEMDKAETTLNKAMDIIPEVGFYVDMAKLYKAQDRKEELDAIMDEVFIMLKDDTDSGHNMDMEYADIYLNVLEDTDKALEYALKEYEKRPSNIDVNKLLSEVYAAQNNKQLSQKHYSLAMRTKGTSTKTVNG